jgi:hypothetical protein
VCSSFMSRVGAAGWGAGAGLRRCTAAGRRPVGEGRPTPPPNARARPWSVPRSVIRRHLRAGGGREGGEGGFWIQAAGSVRRGARNRGSLPPPPPQLAPIADGGEEEYSSSGAARDVEAGLTDPASPPRGARG